jgi:hypothetical protein
MNRSIHLAPVELTNLVIQAARNAESEGFWKGDITAGEDAARHLVRLLGLLLGGDNDVNLNEIALLGEVFQAATGTEASNEQLLESVKESVALADDPEAVNQFLCATPPFMQAVLDMDRARGTRNAEQVVAAMSGLTLGMLAADGKSEIEEVAVFTTHLGHLRGEVAKLGQPSAD